MLTGAEILAECLLEQNADTVFGYPGAAVLPVYDAFEKYRGLIKHYLTSHEQGAAHAADGFARSSGRHGVCLATSGPGATNLVTGIATAYMDSSPLVAITGNVALPLLGKDSFQEVDIAGITMPVTKHNFIVKDISKLADTVRSAFFIARSGRPGPVLIDILKNVLEQSSQYKYEKPEPIKKADSFPQEDIEKASGLINSAKRVAILAGGGVVLSDASASLIRFAEKLAAPVCVTLMGIGGFPSRHPLFAGMAGLYGAESANRALREADLIIAAGTRFSDRIAGDFKSFAQGAKILHIDADAAEIDKNIQTAASLIGDAERAIEKLTASVKKRPIWFTITGRMFAGDGKFSPAFILNAVEELKGDSIITTEVGCHQMLACKHLGIDRPRGFITSGGLGTMGFGLPAAIGAAVANPGTTVINIAGDGCFRMNNIELATVVENDLPIMEIIVNNHALGMVRTGLATKKTDFVKLSEAYGAKAIRVSDGKTFKNALASAISDKITTVFDCDIDEDGLEWK